MSNSIAGIALVGFVFAIVGTASFVVLSSDWRDREVSVLLEDANSTLAKGDMEAASKLYEEVVRRDASNQEAIYALFDLHAYFDRDRGRKLLAKAQSLHPDVEGMVYRQVRLAVMDDDLEAARLALRTMAGRPGRGREGKLAELIVDYEDGSFEKANVLLSELNNSYPRDRLLRQVTANVLAAQSNTLNRIQAKDRFLKLLDRSDEFSFKAAVSLLLPSGLTIFNEDLEAAANHLEKHPYLEQGISQLDTPMTRLLVLRLIELHTELAFRLCHELVGREEALADDRLLWIYCGQLAGKEDDVRPELKKVAGGEVHSTQIRILLARQMVLEGQPAQALGILETGTAAAPSSSSLLEYIQAFATDHAGSLDDASQERIADMIRRHPLVAPKAYLQACDLILQAAPGRQDEIFEEAINHLRERDLLLVLRWLNGHQAHAKVVEIQSRQQALASAPAFAVHFDALLGLGRYEDARQLVLSGRDINSEWQRNLYQARVCLQEGDRDTACEFLDRVIEMRGLDDRRHLFQIVDLIQDLDLPELKSKAWTAAYKFGLVFPPKQALAYLDLLLRSGSIEDSLRFASYCHNLQPENPFYINNLCYLQIISNRAIGDCIEQMRQLVDRYPQVDIFRLTLAFGELVGGLPGQARETLESVDALQPGGEPRSLMVRAIVLAGTGDQLMASSILDSVDLTSLLDPERSLLNRYLTNGTF